LLACVELITLPAVTMCSAYASWEDLRRLEYPPQIDKILLALGSASILWSLMTRELTFAALLEVALGLALTPGALFVLYKLGAVGEGDLRYSLAISLCFPSYPAVTTQLLRNLSPTLPTISCRTPFPTVVLTNGLWLAGIVLAAQRLTATKRSKLLSLAFVPATLLAAKVLSHGFLALLPLPLAMCPTPKPREVPMIPMLFGGLLIALTVGDLSLLILR
jgi:hypothetical protein